MRAFVTLGPGGVGQSLNTALIANVFGDTHGFVDMNVFYTEDELRKQADTFTGKVRKGTHNILVSVFPAFNFGLVLFSCCIFQYFQSSGGDDRAGDSEHRQTSS